MFVWGTFSLSTQTGSFTWEIMSRDKYNAEIAVKSGALYTGDFGVAPKLQP